MLWRRSLRLTNIEIALVLILAIAITAPTTLLLRDVVTGRSLPPGCVEADKTTPGCRPTGRPITQNVLTIAAVILAPLSALLVAVITARTTDERQARALADQRRQLKWQIRAENERHALSLEQERAKDELNEVRRVLDGAVEAVMRVTDDIFAVESAWSSAGRGTVPEVDEKLDAMRDRANQSLNQLAGYWYRVVLRLGEDHVASGAFEGAVLAFRDFLDSMTDEAGECSLEQMSSARNRAQSEVERFRRAAASEVAVRLSDGADVPRATVAASSDREDRRV